MRGGAGVRSSTVLVGREVEVDHLLRAVRAARDGHSSCTLVIGEGGLGKSRLLDEAAATARRLGLGVAVGRAPISVLSPFSVVTEALRSWLRGRTMATTNSPFDQGLRLLLPEWQVPAGESVDLSAVQLRLLALEGIVVVLRTIVAASGGAALILDDLHGVDPDSLEAVRYVLSAAVDGLAIIGALRPGESSSADELVRAVRGDGRATLVELDPLGPRAVTDLVAALLDAAPPPELVADVVARTDGVPLLVEEVVDAHIRAGSIQVEAGETCWRSGTVVVPRSVRGMVEARLEQLPPPLRDVVLAGAVLGRFEPAFLVAAVAGVDSEGEVGDAVSLGVDVGLLATRGGTLGFRHDVVRDGVLDAAVPLVVKAMHARAAAALSEADADGRRAEHLAAAGHDEEAAESFVAVAMSELAGHALLSAERFARRGLGLARTGVARAAAADALASVLAAQGRWAEALAVDEETVALQGETDGRRNRMATTALEAGDPDTARAALERAGDQPLTRVLSGRVALVAGDAAAALAESDAVLSEDVDVDTRLAALDLKARALDFLGHRSGAAQAWARQAGEARAARRTQAELRAVFQVGKLEFFDGRGPDRLREAVALARNAGALIELAWAEETLAIALLLQGEPAAALEVLDVAIPRARELRLDQLAYLLTARAGVLSFIRDSVDELFAEAEAINPSPDIRLSHAMIRSDIALRHGRFQEAVALFEAGRKLLTAMPGVAPSDIGCRMVWAYAALGRTDQAASALRRAEGVPDLARWHPRPVWVAAGRALLAGDPAGVDAAIDAARGPMPFDIALMRVIGARVLGGDVRIPWLRQALDIYETTGATAYHQLVRGLLRDAGGPVPRRRRPGTVPGQLADHGITAREAEVLRLLGNGRSNADIAAKLFVSVRTVETHVSSLLAKLNARSRGQLTALSTGIDFTV